MEYKKDTNNQDIAFNMAEFLGQDVEPEGIKMMQDERVVPFGTALWP